MDYKRQITGKMKIDELTESNLMDKEASSSEVVDHVDYSASSSSTNQTNEELTYKSGDRKEYLSNGLASNAYKITDNADNEAVEIKKQRMVLTEHSYEENDDVEIILIGSSQNDENDNSEQNQFVESMEVMKSPKSFSGSGPMPRPRLKVNDEVYAMKLPPYIYPWRRGVISAICRGISEMDDVHAVKFTEESKNGKELVNKALEGKYLAYSTECPTLFDVGSRVIAILSKTNAPTENDCLQRRYYSGVVAELPKSANKNRYMIFFDNGYAQYVAHEDIRVIYRSSMDILDDVSPGNKEFVRKYLLEYPNYPRVRLSAGSVINVEYKQNWCRARVIQVDASLVKVCFLIDGREEWIYRGSTRLALFQKIVSSPQGNAAIRRIQQIVTVKRKKMQLDRDVKCANNTTEAEEIENKSVALIRANVARKSTKPTLVISNIKNYSQPWNIDLDRGVIVRANPNRICPKEFEAHICSRACVEWINYDPSKSVGIGPLAIPFHFGFRRIVTVYRRRTNIVYIGPCGRRLFTMKDINDYLKIMKSAFTIDMFSLDKQIHCLNEFVVEKANVMIPDITYGQESQPISCVNYIDYDVPMFPGYMTERIATAGVPLNLDSDFLCSCDCTDDCQDKKNCSCWRLTHQAYQALRGNVSKPRVGYYYRRLRNSVLTGIYECNSRCKCSKKSCSNRVVQQPTSQKLQLFKTEMKGWGVRCLNDIPRGGFICIYVGCLMTEHDADKEGKHYGDEYFAELDYMEVVENSKQGYEAKPPDALMEFINSNKEEDEENDIFGNGSESSDDINSSICDFDDFSDVASFKQLKYKDFTKLVNERMNVSKKSTTTTSGSNNTNGTGKSKLPAYSPMRNYFGRNEKAYIMDAKHNGNIGRYMNHSCSPNVFVQNVFVDTHDLRFPWVTFFAGRHIPAGSELTWDYNYDVGSVKNTVKYCYCKAPNCRGRLL